MLPPDVRYLSVISNILAKPYEISVPGVPTLKYITWRGSVPKLRRTYMYSYHPTRELPAKALNHEVSYGLQQLKNYPAVSATKPTGVIN